MGRPTEYIQNPAYNFSSLAALAGGPKNFLNKEKEETDSMVFGSALDCLLTSPDSFNENFCVLSENKPTGQMGEYCDALFKYFKLYESQKTEEMDTFGMAQEKAYEVAGFKRDSLEAVKQRFLKEGRMYYQQLFKCSNKLVLTPEEHLKVSNLVSELKNNPWTSRFFVNDDENISILYQYPVYFKYKNFDFKVLYDIVYVDHYDKIIQVFDLKSTSLSLFSFKKSFIKYKYYLQLALYTAGVNQLKTQLEVVEYRYCPMKFIVAEQENYNKPVIFDCSQYLEIGEKGGEIDGRKIKGFLELAEDLKWHTEEGRWEYPREVYLNQGVWKLH